MQLRKNKEFWLIGKQNSLVTIIITVISEQETITLETAILAITQTREICGISKITAITMRVILLLINKANKSTKKKRNLMETIMSKAQCTFLDS